MSKKKGFFSPPQMIILSDFPVTEGTKTIVDFAKPNPFVDGEDDEILLPDGSVGVNDGDVVIPDASDDSGIVPDEAYY